MYEDYLIETLEKVNHVSTRDLPLSKKDKVRALMNITMPYSLGNVFYERQDAFLQEILKDKKIFDTSTLTAPLSIYRGDITAVKADAIVNAGNEELLGCFVPLHGCVDNAIHSAAGLEVRRDLLKIMQEQGHVEPVGQVKVTLGYNLPAKYIFHTVGPQVQGRLTNQDREDLASCYLSCLREAKKRNLKTLVFSSLSTGLYGFPMEEASKIAYSTCDKFIQEEDPGLKVVFDVFSKKDEEVYERVFNNHR